MDERFDFAFSFAGEDRIIVEDIKNYLKKRDYSVFYDNDFTHKLVGKNLYSYLRHIYKESGKYVVCFISENYAKKVWTNLEFSAIKERLMATFFAGDFLIPILLNEAKLLEDIPSYFGFYRHKTTEETGDLLIKKYNTSLAENNYLNNIQNCIDYICNRLYNILSNQGFTVSLNNNSISINNAKSMFTLKPDNVLNIPCILVCSNDNSNPHLFISWNNNDELLFCVHSFTDLNSLKKDIRINDLIKFLEVHIKTESDDII